MTFSGQLTIRPKL